MQVVNMLTTLVLAANCNDVRCRGWCVCVEWAVTTFAVAQRVAARQWVACEVRANSQLYNNHVKAASAASNDASEGNGNSTAWCTSWRQYLALSRARVQFH